MKKWMAGVLVLCMLAVPCFAEEGTVPLQAPSAVLMTDRKSTRLNSSHVSESRMPSSA